MCGYIANYLYIYISMLMGEAEKVKELSLTTVKDGIEGLNPGYACVVFPR